MNGNVTARPDRVHELKTWRIFFDDLASGMMTFNIRREDRDFGIGDIALFREWLPTEDRFSGRETRKLITYVVHGGAGNFRPLAGLKPGYCVLGLAEVPEV